MTNRQHLIELLEDTLHEWECDASIKTLTEIAEHLIENRVIVLPCKVGDTIYQTDGVRIYKSRVKQIIYDTDNIAFDERAIGKTVFLTYEEAEKALKERESNA